MTTEVLLVILILTQLRVPAMAVKLNALRKRIWRRKIRRAWRKLRSAN